MADNDDKQQEPNDPNRVTPGAGEEETPASAATSGPATGQFVATDQELDYAEILLGYIENDDIEHIRRMVDDLHAADLAGALEKLEPEMRRHFYLLSGLHNTADALAYLPNEQLAQDIHDTEELTDKRRLLTDLPDDELADVFQHLEQEEREQLFALLPQKTRDLVRRLLAYDEESAGGNMTTEFAFVTETMSVGEAKAKLRREQEKLEFLSRIFVLDHKNRLLGKIRLRDMTFAPDDTPVGELNDEDTTCAFVDDDQEDAARLLAKYDLVALPVVNHNNVMLGIMTHDDAMDILEAESTEDIEMIAAVQASASEVGYLETPVVRHFRRRIGWVIILAALGLVSGYIIYAFEDVLSTYFILAIYMPVIVAAGGNTGGQAATLVIRAMSLNEFDPRAFLRVLWKEVRIGLMIGIVLAFLVGIKIQFFSTEKELEGVPSAGAVMLVVSLAFVFQVITSTTIGAVLPMTARALRLDPAVVASPAITTFVDVSGLLIYFTLAKAILGL